MSTGPGFVEGPGGAIRPVRTDTTAMKKGKKKKKKEGDKTRSAFAVRRTAQAKRYEVWGGESLV